MTAGSLEEAVYQTRSVRSTHPWTLVAQMGYRPAPAPSAGRLFLDVAITDEVAHAIRRHLEAAHIPGRLVLPEDWHLTLRFLGEASPEALETLETLRKTLGAADLGLRTEIVFGRLGAFPSPDRAGVVWLGVGEGAADLATIQSRVAAAARRAGFPASTLPFTPHVTLSRPEPPADVRDLVKRMPTLAERMIVDAVVLFRRRLGRRHGRYEDVARYPLRDPD